MVRRAAFAVFSRLFRVLFGTRVARLVWRIPGSQPFYRALMRHMAPGSVVVDGHELELDPTDSLLLSVHGSYEAFELGLFERCIQPDDVVVDVGAHIGLYTLSAARATGPGGRVVAFEPSRQNYDLLVRNVAANGYRTVEPVRAALADHEGEADLHVSAQNSGDNSLSATAVGPAAAERVRLLTLDAYAAEHAVHPQVVKMDIQGGEPAALAGGRTLLVGSKALTLFTEVSPVHLDGIHGAEAFVAQLRDLGLELFVVDESSRSVRPMRGDELAAESRTAGHDGHLNLVCTKGTEARARLDAAVTALTGAGSGTA
jgi:FkbM family methyltransferase